MCLPPPSRPISVCLTLAVAALFGMLGITHGDGAAKAAEAAKAEATPDAAAEKKAAEEKVATDKAAADKAAAEKAAAEKAAAEKAAADKAAAEKAAADKAAADKAAADKAAAEKAAADKAAAEKAAADKAAADKAAAEKAAADKAAAEKAAADKAAAEKAAADKAAAEKAAADKAAADKAAAEKAAALPKPEPRLRFQFRFQRWADVLEWFARQADLSLVLDAPPPGTFNYSDTREYTPAEAIDLLNGVLQTKGYTLIRRDRMLMVINLKDGLPDDLVPPIALEELDKRGKFEMVTVRFPLAGRAAETVIAEIKPILGKYGKIVLLPASAQIQVTDTTGIMRSVQVLIQSIAVPDAPAAVPPAETAVMAHYPLKPADPATVQTAFKTLLPNVKATCDEMADQVHVFAAPSEQAVAKTLMDDMRSGNPEDQKPHMELYTVSDSISRQVITFLRTAMPKVIFSLDTRADKIAAWCTKEDHEAIKRTIAKLQEETAEGRSRQLEVYRLIGVEPTATLTFLQSTLPDVKMSLDRESGNLLAWGTPEEHQRLGAALAKFGSAPGREEPVQVETFKLTKAYPTTTLTLLQSLVPHAKVSYDPTIGSIVALANADDRKIIGETLARLQPTEPDQNTPELGYHVFKQEPPADLLTVLKTAVPLATLKLDTDGKRLTILATPNDQAFLKILLERYEKIALPEEKSQLVLYPVTPEQKTRVQAVVAALATDLPGLRIIADGEPTQLAVWAKPEQHERIRGTIEQLKQEPPQLEIFKLTKANPSTTLPLLQSLVPRAKVSYDPTMGSIVALANADDRKIIGETLARLQPTEPDQNTPELGYHVFKQEPPADLLTVLKTAVPLATLKLDTDGKRLTILATPNDQAFLKILLERYEKIALPEEKGQLVLYPVTPEQKTRVQAVIAALAADLPGIKIIADGEPTQLAVWAKPEQHERIRGTIDQLKQEPPQVEIFKLTKANPSTTLPLLQSIVPRAKVSFDPAIGSIVALANADDRKIIGETLARLQPTQPDENTPELSYHVFKQQPPADLLTVLKTAVPLATLKLETDGKRLTILATPNDQAFLKILLERYEKIALPEEKSQLALYPVTPEQKARFQAVMTTVAADLPGIKVVADAEPNQLTIWAKPEQHEILHGIIEQLRQEVSPELKSQLVVYSLKSMDPANVVTLLTPMFPSAKLVPSKKARKLAVWARPEEQTIIGNAVQQIEAGAAEAGQEKVQSYVSPTTDPAVAIGVLDDLFPDAKLQGDLKTGTIIASATQADHEQIRKTLDDMRLENAEGKKPHMEVYSLNAQNPAALVAYLQSLVPTARVTIDPDSQDLAVFGAPKDHETIRDVMVKLGAGGAPTGGAGGTARAPLDAARQVEAYPLTKAEPTSTITLLRTLVPKAKLSIDPHTQRLIALASLADHSVIRGTLEQLQPEKAGPNDPELQFYTLKRPAPMTMITAVQALAPTARITLDPTAKRLMVVAPPSEQQQIKKNVERFETAAAAEGTERLSVYPLKTTDPTVAVATLSKMFPQAEFTADRKTRRIVVLTRTEDDEAIRKAVEQLDAGRSGEGADTVTVYPLLAADPKGVSDMLQDLFPEMTFTPDIKNQAIIVKGTHAGQQIIAGIVERMNDPDEKIRPRVVAYPCGEANPLTLQRLIAQLVPKGTVSADPKTHTIVALATPKEHEAIRDAVEKLVKSEAKETAPTAVSYFLRTADAATVMRLLATMLPDAQFTVGTDPRQLMAFARPADQAIVKAAVEQMDSEQRFDNDRVMAIYSVPVKDAAALSQIFDPSTLKNAKITPMPNREGLLVWAEPKQQEVIKKALEDFKRELPKALEATTKTYRFERADARAAVQAITALVPTARVVLDANARSVIVGALPEDQEKIAAAVAEMDRELESPELAPSVVSYFLRTADAATVIRLLTPTLPNAQFSVGTDPRQLMAYARPADQAIIKAAVEQMDSEQRFDNDRVMAVYSVPVKDAAALSQIFDPSTLKNAKITPMPNREGLLVWAEPKQQEVIKKALEDFKRELPKALEATTKTYRFERADARAAVQAITALVPTARVVLDANARSVIVSALPEDQDKIAAAVAEMDRELESPELAPSVVSYFLRTADAATVIRLLTPTLPNAQFSVGTDPRQLMAYARPADQVIIKAAVEQMDSEQRFDNDRVMAVYSVPVKDAAALSQIFDPSTLKNAKITPMPNREGLLVWAEPKQQEVIKKALQDFKRELPKASEATAKVYRFQRADAKAALAAMTAIAPGAKIALDANARALIVSALPEDQEKIAAAVAEMDRAESSTDAKLRVHRVATVDPQNLLTVLQGLFRTRPEVQLSLDAQHDAIVAVASPEEQETIANLIAQVEKATPDEKGATLELYSLQGVEGRGIVASLSRLLEKHGGKVDLTVDPFGRQLVALAKPEQHKLLRDTLDILRGGEKMLDILQLETLETSTAQKAIQQLFADDSVHEPDVEIDYATDQLFVRGTPEQLKKIRELLARMGETALKDVPSPIASGPIRTIPVRGDAKATVEELLQMWPQLRKNPIRVVTPSAIAPALRQETEKATAPATPTGDTTPATPTTPAKPAAAPASENKQSSWIPRSSDMLCFNLASMLMGEVAAAPAPAPAPATPPATATPTPPSPTPAPAASAPAEPPTAAAAPAVAPAAAVKPSDATAEKDALPVLISVSGENILIASNDQEALDYLESLLRMMSRASAGPGRNYSIHLLKHAAASNVAATLQGLFRGGQSGMRGLSPILIIADERMNAILVQANRTDRATIENYLKIIDSDEMPASLNALQPVTVVLNHSKASRIEHMLRAVFKSQLTTGRGGPSSGGSTGLIGTDMTIDDVTNSLIITAPPALAQRLADFARSLDQSAAENASEEITIVPLKNTNASRAQQILNVLLDDGQGTRKAVRRK